MRLLVAAVAVASSVVLCGDCVSPRWCALILLPFKGTGLLRSCLRLVYLLLLACAAACLRKHLLTHPVALYSKAQACSASVSCCRGCHFSCCLLRYVCQTRPSAHACFSYISCCGFAQAFADSGAGSLLPQTVLPPLLGVSAAPAAIVTMHAADLPGRNTKHLCLPYISFHSF